MDTMHAETSFPPPPYPSGQKESNNTTTSPNQAPPSDDTPPSNPRSAAHAKALASLIDYHRSTHKYYASMLSPEELAIVNNPENIDPCYLEKVCAQDIMPRCDWSVGYKLRQFLKKIQGVMIAFQHYLPEHPEFRQSLSGSLALIFKTAAKGSDKTIRRIIRSYKDMGAKMEDIYPLGGKLNVQWPKEMANFVLGEYYGVLVAQCRDFVKFCKSSKYCTILHFLSGRPIRDHITRMCRLDAVRREIAAIKLIDLANQLQEMGSLLEHTMQQHQQTAPGQPSSSSSSPFGIRSEQPPPAYR